MARKTKVVTIDTEGRDKGRSFLLTEMPASAAEEWGLYAVLALSRAGFEVTSEMRRAGMMAIAVVGGLNALNRLAPADAKYLMDRLMACVKAMPSSGVTRELVEDDIDEVLTRLYLKAEVFELHTGFKVADAILKSVASAFPKIPRISSNTPTSRRRSARPSRVA
jgi:hypothetical protein